MPKLEIKNTYSLPPRSGGKPDNLVILLHGLGSDGKDLIGLGAELSPSLPNTQFIAPDAPFACDMSPMGYQWFSLLDRNPKKMLEGLQTIAPILNAFIDAQLKEFNLTDKALALVGFSQGTMLSLYVAPRRPNSCALVVGYSGALIPDENTPIQSRPKMLLIHGTQDDVVPFYLHEAAVTELEKQAFDVSSLSRPGLAHSIDLEGLKAAQHALKKAFNVSETLS